ncbi:unnamed protein product, partial [marine sediment metagenome]
MSLIKNVKPIVKIKHEEKIYYHKDPMDFLIKNGLVVQVGNGLFVIGGVLVNILNKIEELICEIAKNVDAEPVFVPSILSWENTKKSQYLNSFKNQALMIQPFGGNTKQEKDYPYSIYEGMNSPTVCYHYFSSLSHKTVDKNYSITALGKCTR